MKRKIRRLKQNQSKKNKNKNKKTNTKSDKQANNTNQDSDDIKRFIFISVFFSILIFSQMLLHVIVDISPIQIYKYEYE